MANDSFFREVNDELRSDRAKELWRRYGAVVVGLAIAVVVATAAWRGYEYWTASKASKSGDQFLAALDLAQQGKNDEALAALDKLEKTGYGQYSVLARMRAATVTADKGDKAAAVKAFDAVAADTAVPEAIRDVAELRSAYLLVDTGSYDDVARRAEPLSADGNPFRHSAREALGLAAWKKGDKADAAKLFNQIANDGGAPANLRQRASMMLGLLRADGVKIDDKAAG